MYFIFITLVSGSVYLWRVSLWEFLWRAGSYFLCGAPLCRVSGRYNLFECWPWVSGGAVQFFSSLGSVVVGTVRLKWWGGVVRFFFAFFSFLSAVVAGGCLW